MVNLLFNPQGRIQAGPFWQGVIILLVAGIVIQAIQTYVAPPSMSLLLGLLAIVLIYPTVCVYVKRFHDSGRSGWWFLAVIGVSLVLNFIIGIVLTLNNADMMAAQQEVPPFSPEWQSMQQAMARQLFLPSIVIGTVISLAIAFVVARLKSDPGENRFGPPPGATGQAGAL